MFRSAHCLTTQQEHIFMKKLPSRFPGDATDARRSFLRLAFGTGASAAIGGGLLAACGGGDPETADGRAQPLSTTTTTCAPTTYPVAVLGVGGATVATMTVSNTSTTLDLSFAAATGCEMQSVFVWVGNDPTNVPNNGIDVDFNAFPHKILGIAQPGSSAQLSVALDSISLPSDPCTQPLYIFAKVFTTCGFGWAAGGVSYLGYPYVSYQLCGLDCTVLQGCETAFAKGGYVFASEARANPEGLTSLRLTRNRWGWAIRHTGAGTEEYDVYAGAGLNNTTNGTRVGTVSITWNGSGTVATVTYSLVSGVVMTEAHLYAGSTSPTTIAPGQYGNNASFTTPVSSHTFTTAPLSGSTAWFIVHAVVC
jgi:hypothetical protein